jgi:hypothetical protein
MKKITLLLFVAVLSDGHSQNLLNGLQACYPMDNSPQNFAVTGSVANGTAVNLTDTAGHTGLPGTAYRFSGNAGSYFIVPGNSQIKSTSAITVSGWFNVDANPGAYDQYLLYTKNNCSVNWEAVALYVKFSGNMVSFNTEKHASPSCHGLDVIQPAFIPANTWHHVVFYIDNFSSELYVNGTLVDSAAHSVPFDYMAGKDIILGGSNESPFYFPFKGNMDNIRFYNRKLTAAEINLLYLNEGMCSPDVTAISVHDPGADVMLYPNPTNGKIYLNSKKSCSFTIYDLNGKILRDGALNGGSNEIALDIQTGGIYIIRFFDDSGSCMQTRKFAVIR